MADRLVETHSSTLFFVDDLVFKRKKPLDLGFVDFSTGEARRTACEAEVTLNRRLAPDVYKGVATLIGPDGEMLDSLVMMRRLPDERRLGALIVAGHDVTSALLRIAQQLADLHARARAPDRLSHLGTARTVVALWDAGLDALCVYPDIVGAETRERSRSLAHRYVDGRAALFDSRIAAGRLVDGHGDLLTDDVFVLADGPRLLDCLDFDERLRVTDGLADAVSLAMDLEHLGHLDLATLFINAYRRTANDDAPMSLQHF